MRIAIIGMGFVGSAVKNSMRELEFLHGFNFQEIDPKLGTSRADLENPDITFVCVPTGMNDDGTINSSILEETLDYLITHFNSLIVVKSTITPDLAKKYENHILYNPEFLTEANANNDMLHPQLQVFGTLRKTDAVALEHFYKRYTYIADCPIHVVTPVEASFIKYGINSYLASKVTWFNQFELLVSGYGADYKAVTKAMSGDKRIGSSHMQVPGPDGKRGFGGSCFTKDTMALIRFSQSHTVPFALLEEIIEYNNKIRSQYELSDREKEQNVRYDIEI